MKGISDIVRRFARSMGYEVIPTWRLDSWSLEKHLTTLFHDLKVDCVFDVGANRGQYRNFLRNHIGYKGPIHSFEPIPELVVELEQAAKVDPNWTIHGYALGTESKTLEFNVMRSNDFSSFLQPNQTAPREFHSKNVPDRHISVPVKTLSEILPSIQTNRPYLKLDTQGFDLEVVRGGASVMELFVALQIESSVIPLYEGMPTFSETIQTLEKLGFAISGLFPVVTVKHHLIEFDCVMIKKNIAT